MNLVEPGSEIGRVTQVAALSVEADMPRLAEVVGLQIAQVGLLDPGIGPTAAISVEVDIARAAVLFVEAGIAQSIAPIVGLGIARAGATQFAADIAQNVGLLIAGFEIAWAVAYLFAAADTTRVAGPGTARAAEPVAGGIARVALGTVQNETDTGWAALGLQNTVHSQDPSVIPVEIADLAQIVIALFEVGRLLLLATNVLPLE